MNLMPLVWLNYKYYRHVLMLLETTMHNILLFNAYIFISILPRTKYSYPCHGHFYTTTLFTFPIIWPCVLDLFEYQIMSTTFLLCAQ